MRVTDLGELVFPTFALPKFKLLAESVTAAPPPLPARLTTWGLFGALSVNVSVPVNGPTALGENVTPTMQLAPAAILVPQLLLATLKLALATIPEKFTATLC